MKRARLFYGGLLLSAAYLTYRRPGFISTVAFYILLLVALLDLLLLLASLASIKLTQQLNKQRVNKGESLLYRLTIKNRGPLLLAPFRVHYCASDLLFKNITRDQTVQRLYPWRRATIEQTLQCRYRGNYHIGVDYLHFTSIFGLFSYKYKRLVTDTIRVVPKIYPLLRNRQFDPARDVTQSATSIDSGDRTNFSEILPYRQGDPLNRIHWKLSAKHGQLISKHFAGQLNQKVNLYLYNQRYDLPLEERLVLEDHVIESVLAVVKDTLDLTIDSQLHFLGGQPGALAGADQTDFGRFFELLTELQFIEDATQKEQLLRALVAQPSGSNIMLFSASLDEALTASLLRCAAQDCRVFLVLSSVELSAGQHHIKLYQDEQLYPLIDRRISVLQPIFTDNLCRFEVIS